jgi:HEAT repeat protein
LPDLIDRVRLDAEPEVRARAARALGAIGERTLETTVCLGDAARDPDALVRREAVAAVVHLEPPDPTDLQLLRDALSDPEPEVRETAVWAMRFLRPRTELVRDALVSSLIDPEPNVREEACRQLGEMGSLAIPALPELGRLAQSDPSSDVQRFAREASSRIRP